MDHVEGSIAVNVPFATLVRILQDVPAEAEWIGPLKNFETLETYDDGLVKRGRLTTDLGVAKDIYEMEYTYEPDRMNYKLATQSKLQKRQEGSYIAVDAGDGTSTYTVLLDTENTVPAPGIVRRRVTKTVLNSTLSGLKKFAEANADRYAS